MGQEDTSSPEDQVYDKVRVTFKDKQARDSVASKGILLAKFVDKENRPTAGFRLDVPDYVAGDFKSLQEYGYYMRGLHGKQTKRHVKYDDEELSLYMELRVPDSPLWLRVTPELAKELKQQADKEELQTLARPRRMSNESPNFLKITDSGPFTVRQPVHEETDEQMMERTNERLRKEASNKRRPRPLRLGWGGTSTMDEIERESDEEDDRGTASDGGAFVSKPAGSQPTKTGGPAAEEAFNLWMPSPQKDTGV